MLSTDAEVIRVEADRITQLAKQKFDQNFGDVDQKDGGSSVVLANLYSKAGDISMEIMNKADELHTCLTLIEEIEQDNAKRTEDRTS